MEKVAIIRETEPTELSTIYQLSNSLTNLSMSDSNFFFGKIFYELSIILYYFFYYSSRGSIKKWTCLFLELWKKISDNVVLWCGSCGKSIPAGCVFPHILICDLWQWEFLTKVPARKRPILLKLNNFPSTQQIFMMISFIIGKLFMLFVGVLGTPLSWPGYLFVSLEHTLISKDISNSEKMFLFCGLNRSPVKMLLTKGKLSKAQYIFFQFQLKNSL